MKTEYIAFRPYVRSIAWGVGASALGAFALTFGFLDEIDWRILDRWQKSRPPHPDIVLLAVDSKSLDSIGRWPWNRSVHAQILNRLAQAPPKAVGIDINFSEPQNAQNDIELADTIEKSPFTVVLPALPVYENAGKSPARFTLPLKAFALHTNVRLGHVGTIPDSDGTARRFPKAVAAAGNRFRSFGEELASTANPITLDERDLAIRFAGKPGTIPAYSISDFLGGKIDPEVFRDRFVLIGATASDLHDVAQSPVGFMAGIEWHATILDNILTGDALRIVPPWRVRWLGFGAAAALTILFSFLRLNASVFVALLGTLAWPFWAAVLWQRGVALPYVSSMVLVATVFATHAVRSWYISEARRRKLKQTVQSYFSPQVLSVILRNPEKLKLGGEQRDVTVFFSDIRSFTTITESTPPQILSALLHDYFTKMTEEIIATDGVVDKFIGDAIMAFWGAPLTQTDHAERAVRAAIKMLKKLPFLQKEWEARGWPHIAIGIGINTGLCTVGNLGSENRFDYTVIGDTVNAASRLEGLTKEYKTPLIISQSTKKLLPPDIACRELGAVMVKGKMQQMQIYGIET